MHYYQFNIGDYASHTAHLEPLEDIAYRRMLDWCYLHERPLPDDVQQIGKLIRMRSHTDCIASVLQEFFDLTPSGWWKDRIGEEIAVANEKREKAKASANARWHKEKSDANALPAQSEGNAPNTQDTRPNTQDTKPKTQKKAPAVLCPSDVDQKVWDDYLVIRKAKNLPVTETALADIRREAERAGMGLGQAIHECVTRGWAGFKAKWLVEKMTLAEQRMNTMHQLTGGITTPKVGNFWDKPKTDNVIEAENVERKRLL